MRTEAEVQKRLEECRGHVVSAITYGGDQRQVRHLQHLVEQLEWVLEIAPDGIKVEAPSQEVR